MQDAPDTGPGGRVWLPRDPMWISKKEDGVLSVLIKEQRGESCGCG